MSSVSVKQNSTTAGTSGKTVATSASVLNVPVRNTSWTAACFNLTKSAVGAGTVYLPIILVRLGLVNGSLIFLIAGLLAATSLHFLGRMAHHCETGDYFRLGRLSLGKRGEQAVSVALILYLIGGLIAYANLIGEFFSQAMLKVWSYIQVASWFTTLAEDSVVRSSCTSLFNALTNSGYMTVFLSLVAVFPLALMRDMSKLAKTSIIGMACMLYIAGIFTWEFFSPIDATWERTPIVPVEDSVAYIKEIGSACGSFLFAFVNHFTIVSLVPVMVDPSAKKRSSLIAAATLAAFVIYSAAMYGCYFRFGGRVISKVSSEVLSVYKEHTSTPIAYTLAQVLLSFVLVCSYPLLCDPARMSFDALVFGPKSIISTSFRHYAETAFFVAVPTVVAFYTGNDSSKYLQLFSGLCGSMLVFTFPGLFFIILARPYKYAMSRMEEYTARIFIGLGFVLAAVSTYSAVDALLKP